MSAIKWILISLHSSSSHHKLLPIIERSKRGIANYSKLNSDKEWQSLSRLCENELFQISSDLHLLINSIKEVKKLRRNTIDLINKLVKAKEIADKSEFKNLTKNDIVTNENNDESIITNFILTKKFRQEIFISASHNLLLHKKAILENFVQAEINYNATLLNNSTNTLFTSNDNFININLKSVKKKIIQYRTFLNKKQEQVYISALNQSSDLETNLYKLSSWVIQNIREVVKLQSTLQVLLENKFIKDNNELYKAILVQLFEVKYLINELIASDISSTLCVLSKNSITLNQNIPEIFKRAGTTPFHGRIILGKKINLERLDRLPDNMHMNIKGVITSIRTEEKKGKRAKKVLHIGALQDLDSNLSIPLISSQNFTNLGIIEGSHIRVSAFYRKNGTNAFKEKHLEVEVLKIKETYAIDIWKIAFLDLSATYHNIWPSYNNIEFINPLELKSSSSSTNSSSDGLKNRCNDEFEAYLAASQEADIADNEVVTAHLECLASAIAVAYLCVLTPLSGGAAIGLCLAAIAADFKTLNDLNTAYKKQRIAEERMAKAKKAWEACLNAPSGGVGSGSTGSTGSSGSGSSSGGGLDWDNIPDESIPDWVVDWEDPYSDNGNSTSGDNDDDWDWLDDDDDWNEDDDDESDSSSLYV